jgi:16S rRNA (cytosine1402-N4)-methyltransferase
MLCGMLHGAGRLIALDVDVAAIHRAEIRLGRLSSRVTLIRENFSHIQSVLNEQGVRFIHGLLLDLGVSSFQFDEPLRGFSFRHGARIDMRMDDRQVVSGWDVVNSYDEQELSEILREYGEERFARRIARVICASRPIDSTQALRDVVGRVVGSRYLIKSLARVFQAIRIEVNQELQNLEIALRDVVPVLVPGGRVVVISYHSLEDRLVKHFFRAGKHGMRALTRKPIIPLSPETDENPRARSAKLRAAERINKDDDPGAGKN